MSKSTAGYRRPKRWSRYVADSLIETSIARDVLLLTRVDKPALLRRLNTALMTATSGLTLREAKADGEYWGRLLESAVGAHLANAAAAGTCEVYYWRERGREVDFVVRIGRRVTAIEVKSANARGVERSMAAFAEAFKPKRTLLVRAGGIGPDEFLSRPVEHWTAP